MSNLPDRIKSEAARKAEIRYASQRQLSPIKWGWLCDGFEEGYRDCATQLAEAQERIKSLEIALRKIRDNILEQGPKEVAIDNRLHMIIYSALHTANEALSPT